MRKIAHIINPVIVSESSDLFVAQPITFETMKTAREFAWGQVEVTLFSAQYLQDRPLVPEGFHLTPDLERSILDVGTFQKKRKLPLIKDILDRLYEATDADYLIYTNVDIALMPYFYVIVDKLIDQGYDAFTINRRTISNTYQRLEDITLMYAQAGEPHPGHDCFVFRRGVYPSYYLASVCIGSGWVGAVLMLNLMSHATKFKSFENLHLTFHLGDDRTWGSLELEDYLRYNEGELHKVLRYYEAEKNFPDHPSFRHHIAQMRQDRLDVSQKRTNSFSKRVVKKLVSRLGSCIRR